MTTGIKTVVGILAVVIIGGLIWYGTSKNQSEPAPENNVGAMNSKAAPVNTTSPKDASDEAIIKDTAQIDAQMKGLDNDSSTANQGVNDKPITQ